CILYPPSGGLVANSKSEIRSPKFEWAVYADATCAGLSVLIPLPLVDLVFETVFRRRIPGKIARVRKSEVAPQTKVKLARPVNDALSWSGCLAMPFMIVRYVLRRLWRKIIYIFAVKDATTALTEYWHRAFLIDHMIRAGHLAPDVDTDLAVRVYRQVLQEIDPSPLMGLARQTVANVRHVLRLLVRARRLGAAEVTKSLGDVLSSHWKVASASLITTSQRYNARYAAEVELKERSR
ncbi:MAG: hypothetical protein OQK55_03730, partial [Thermoanaerobaculales bacterium]|nr:hypothetical protein [Thermoanaerobaculales bacterium]